MGFAYRIAAAQIGLTRQPNGHIQFLYSIIQNAKSQYPRSKYLSTPSKREQNRRADGSTTNKTAEKKQHRAPSPPWRHRLPYALLQDAVCLGEDIPAHATARLDLAPQNEVRLVKISAVARAQHDQLLLTSFYHSPLLSSIVLNGVFDGKGKKKATDGKIFPFRLPNATIFRESTQKKHEPPRKYPPFTVRFPFFVALLSRLVERFFVIIHFFPFFAIDTEKKSVYNNIKQFMTA